MVRAHLAMASDERGRSDNGIREIDTQKEPLIIPTALSFELKLLINN